MFVRLEMSMVIMVFFVISFKSNLFLELLCLVEMTLVFLEGLLTLINVDEKVKIFNIIEKRKLRGTVNASFHLKSFLSYINFGLNQAQSSFLFSLPKYLNT